MLSREQNRGAYDIINNSIETIRDAHTGRYKSYGETIDPYTKERVYVIIIHTPFNTNVKIITVMAVNSKRGLRAHDFSNF
jgi:ribulose bisphosphate carboxylase small subunit